MNFMMEGTEPYPNSPSKPPNIHKINSFDISSFSGDIRRTT